MRDRCFIKKTRFDTLILGGHAVSSESRFAELKEKEREARKQIIIESALSLFSKTVL